MLPLCPHFPFISPLSSPTSSVLLPHPQADVNKDYRGQTPLHIAAKEGSTEIAALLIEAKADMTIACQGRTPLDIARQQGHTEIVDLIEALFPLYAAAAKGDIALVTRLIEEGQEDINQMNDKGVTPLYITVKEGNTEIAALLIEAKVRSVCWRGA